MKRTLFHFLNFLIIFLTVAPQIGNAQCRPVIKNISETICSGDSLYGYKQSGIYKDTFSLGQGCDSIRVLDLFVTPHTGNAPAPSWFNTGTNGSGGRLPAGSQDLNWKLGYSLTGSYSPAYVMKNPPGSYTNSPWPDCGWIAHSPDGQHSGNVDFYYKIEFDLPCFDACGYSFNADTTFCLSLDFYADNSVTEIYINGIPQSSKLGGVIPVALPYGYEGYKTANSASVSLCDDWKSGQNTLVIKVSSGAPYEAFLAQASVKIPTPKPIQSDFTTSGAAAGGIDSACAPYSVKFTNKSISASKFIWNFGDGSPQDSTTNPSHLYGLKGTYKVSLYAYNDTICTISDTSFLTIVVLGDTTLTMTKDTAACFSSAHTLKAKDLSGRNFVWSNNSSGNELTVTQSGKYWVRYETGKCILRVDTFNLWFPKSILPKIDSLKSCKDEMNGSAWVKPATNDPNSYSFSWWKAGDPSILSISDSLTNVQSGTYYVQVSSSEGCDTIMKVFIPEDKGFKLSFTPTDTIICLGDPIIFKNLSNSEIKDFVWHFGDSTSSGFSTPTHIYQKSGTFQVTLYDGENKQCTDTAFAIVIVDAPISDISFEMDKDSICIGEKIVFTPFIDSSALKLTWEFGDGVFRNETFSNQTQHAYEKEGVLIAKLTADFRACPSITFEDTILVSPIPKLDLGPDTTMCLNASPLIVFNRSQNPSGTYNYKWSTGDSTETLKITHPGTYRLTLSGSLGCTATEEILVQKDCYIDIPNVFTPNDDGSNDYFFPRGLLSKSAKKLHMQIFNRWGQIVFETNQIDGRGWDGKFNNQPQPSGVYVYIIEAEFSETHMENYQGNVTLLR